MKWASALQAAIHTVKGLFVIPFSATTRINQPTKHLSNKLPPPPTGLHDNACVSCYRFINKSHSDYGRLRSET